MSSDDRDDLVSEAADVEPVRRDVLTGIVERRTPTFSGGYALSGRLAGVESGTMTLVVNGNLVAGTVRTRSAMYRIRPAGTGRHAITRSDPLQLPQGDDPVLPWSRRRAR